MANLEKILDKKIHENAQELAEARIKEFADALVVQSKTIADLEGADEVQSIHIEKARSIVLTLSQNRTRLRDAFIAVGSLFAGVAIQGIIGEYSSTVQRPSYFVFYFIMGIVGTALLVGGLIRK